MGVEDLLEVRDELLAVRLCHVVLHSTADKADVSGVETGYQAADIAPLADGIVHRHSLRQDFAGFLGGNREEGEESNGNPMIYFVVAMVLELVFGILASIITMWFSRHREFHADAGSARLVGREKMIAALQRLKTSYEPQEASTMMAFCINGKSKSLSELFMTHPPLDKRIEALRSGAYLK